MLKLMRMNEEQTERLYESRMKRDFPPSELKTLQAILLMMRRDEYDVFSAERDGRQAAYALLYHPKDGQVVLLDYLAVEPELREQGIGTQFLMRLKECYAQGTDVLLIECERPKAAPDEAEARKRIRFYQYVGAQDTSVRVWLFGVEYSILVLPCKGSMAKEMDWASQILELYRRMLPPELFKENVRLIRA